MPVSTSESGKARPRVRRQFLALASALLAAIAPVAPGVAQVTTVDPDAAIDADLGARTAPSPPSAPTANDTPLETDSSVANWNADQLSTPATASATATATASTAGATTYHEDDLIGAAEGVFGKGAKGLADLIKDLLAKQGAPNGYIVGREAGGAIALGIRYGSGTLHHKVEGEQPVYWTGPSLGFDAGANAASAFVLVYNLNDTADLYHRFGAGEGQAYLLGGFNVSYLRRGNVVLIPVRAGAGLRLGASIGYMKFSHKQKWMPF